MKNPQLAKQTIEKICDELGEAGFTAYGTEKFSLDLFESNKKFIDNLVLDKNIYQFLVDKNLIHLDYCILCGESLNSENTFRFSIFGRYYNMCSDCYEQNVPEHKRVKEGCYIATVCYGSYDHPDVLILRQFRDNILDKTFLGRQLIDAYYMGSPKIARWLHSKHYVNFVVREGVLKPLIGILKTII